MARVKAFFFSGRLKRITCTNGAASGRSIRMWSVKSMSSGQSDACRFEAGSAGDDAVGKCGGFGQHVLGGKTAERDTLFALAIRSFRQTTFGEIAARQD